MFPKHQAEILQRKIPHTHTHTPQAHTKKILTFFSTPLEHTRTISVLKYIDHKNPSSFLPTNISNFSSWWFFTTHWLNICNRFQGIGGIHLQGLGSKKHVSTNHHWMVTSYDSAFHVRRINQNGYTDISLDSDLFRDLFVSQLDIKTPETTKTRKYTWATKPVNDISCRNTDWFIFRDPYFIACDNPCI